MGGVDQRRFPAAVSVALQFQQAYIGISRPKIRSLSGNNVAATGDLPDKIGSVVIIPPKGFLLIDIPIGIRFQCPCIVEDFPIFY
jgi:hypothetical protein